MCGGFPLTTGTFVSVGALSVKNVNEPLTPPVVGENCGLEFEVLFQWECDAAWCPAFTDAINSLWEIRDGTLQDLVAG